MAGRTSRDTLGRSCDRGSSGTIMPGARCSEPPASHGSGGRGERWPVAYSPRRTRRSLNPSTRLASTPASSLRRSSADSTSLPRGRQRLDSITTTHSARPVRTTFTTRSLVKSPFEVTVVCTRGLAGWHSSATPSTLLTCRRLRTLTASPGRSCRTTSPSPDGSPCLYRGASTFTTNSVRSSALAVRCLFTAPGGIAGFR